MTAALPWHAGDHATAADGARLIVVKVDGGAPSVWWWDDGRVVESRERGYHWPADAVPDFADVGTAARWLRSCAEVVRDDVPSDVLGIRRWHAVRDAIQAGATMLVWHPDPAAVACAVTATREWLRVRGGGA